MIRDILEDIGVYGRIILIWILKKSAGRRAGFIWLEIPTICGLL
jgi:hypothetical protein